jgi:CRP/FNR family transcriptional regulator, cyclic AMP receptor protein
VWTAVNVVLATRAWDPYPFILLNLFLSMIAALQAPVIMMSQNRQDAKDRLRSELDFAVNRKAEAEITQLAAKLNRIEDRLDDLAASR